MPRLSIILPAYNAEKYIKEAIDSILNQTFADFELIIADDVSHDKTRELINSYDDSRIIKSHNSINLGKTGTVNRLFKFSNGTYITIHDADDYSHKYRFEEQINCLEKDNDIGFCGTSFITIEESGKEFSMNRMPNSFDEIINNLPKSSQLHGPTIIFRKKHLNKLNEIYRPFFNNNYEDVDLYLRVLSLCKKAINVDQYLYNYRILADSLCRKNIDVRNRNLYKVAYHLFEQRKSDGKDDLMNKRNDLAEAYFNSICKAYILDPSRIHREAASYYMYWRLYSKAIKETVKAISKSPMSIVNYRTMFYCIRKSIR